MRSLRFLMVGLLTVVAVCTASGIGAAQIGAGLVSLTTMVSGVLPIANGGTNSSTALSGSSIAISNGSAIVQGAAGTSTTLLHGNASGAPTYSAVSLTADVTGTLPVGNGGTGITALGTGVATFLGTPSTTNLNAALTSGQIVILKCNSGTATSTTTSATETNLAVCTIPAGQMGANGRLLIEALYKYVGTAGTKTFAIRHSTSSGDTTTGALIAQSAAVSSTLHNFLSKPWYNTNSESAQVGASLTGLVTAAAATGAINTANASYINFNCSTASGDTCGVVGYTVTLYPGV